MGLHNGNLIVITKIIEYLANLGINVTNVNGEPPSIPSIESVVSVVKNYHQMLQEQFRSRFSSRHGSRFSNRY